VKEVGNCNLEKLGFGIDEEYVEALLKRRMSRHSDTDPWASMFVEEARRGSGEYGLVLGHEPK